MRPTTIFTGTDTGGRRFHLAATLVVRTPARREMEDSIVAAPMQRENDDAQQRSLHRAPRTPQGDVSLPPAARRPRPAACSPAVPHLAATAASGDSSRGPATLFAGRVGAHPLSSSRPGPQVPTRGPAGNLAVVAAIRLPRRRCAPSGYAPMSSADGSRNLLALYEGLRTGPSGPALRLDSYMRHAFRRARFLTRQCAALTTGNAACYCEAGGVQAIVRPQ